MRSTRVRQRSKRSTTKTSSKWEGTVAGTVAVLSGSCGIGEYTKKLPKKATKLIVDFGVDNDPSLCYNVSMLTLMLVC